MSSTLESSPILTSSQTDSIDAVHDSFVVGDSSEGILHCKLICLYDFVSNLQPCVSFPGHVLNRDDEGTGGSSLHAVVGEDGNSSSDPHAADDLFSLF